MIALPLCLAAEPGDHCGDRHDEDAEGRHAHERAADHEHHGKQHREEDREQRGQTDDLVRDAIRLAIEIFVRCECIGIADR
jgi:hypothetical protein